jgi:hypothetical protein
MRVDIAPPIRQVVMKFRNALNDSHCRSPLLGRLKQSHRATGGLQLRPNAALGSNCRSLDPPVRSQSPQISLHAGFAPGHTLRAKRSCHVLNGHGPSFNHSGQRVKVKVTLPLFRRTSVVI